MRREPRSKMSAMELCRRAGTRRNIGATSERNHADPLRGDELGLLIVVEREDDNRLTIIQEAE